MEDKTNHERLQKSMSFVCSVGAGKTHNFKRTFTLTGLSGYWSCFTIVNFNRSCNIVDWNWSTATTADNMQVVQGGFFLELSSKYTGFSYNSVMCIYRCWICQCDLLRLCLLQEILVYLSDSKQMSESVRDYETHLATQREPDICMYVVCWCWMACYGNN